MTTYKTTAPGGGSARVVPLRPGNVREATTGGRVPVSIDKRDEYAAKTSPPPYPHAWPFDPTDTAVVRMRPRPVWAAYKAFKRWLASEKFTELMCWAWAGVVYFAIAAYSNKLWG